VHSSPYLFQSETTYCSRHCAGSLSETGDQRSAQSFTYDSEHLPSFSRNFFFPNTHIHTQKRKRKLREVYERNVRGDKPVRKEETNKQKTAVVSPSFVADGLTTSHTDTTERCSWDAENTYDISLRRLLFPPFSAPLCCHSSKLRLSSIILPNRLGVSSSNSL
jgi:hypothetical protein